MISIWHDQKFARIISVILGPQVWAPVLLTVLFFQSGLQRYELLRVVPTLFLLLVLIPIAWVYIAEKRHWISAWDMPKRKERYGFFVGFIFLFILAIYLTKPYMDKLFWDTSLIILAYIVISTIITF